MKRTKVKVSTRMSTTALSALIILGVTGCGTTAETGPEPGVGVRTLALAFEGLEDLGQDYVYEGWVIVDGAPVTTGRFAVDADGVPVPDHFSIAADVAEQAELFVLTIEPAIGDDPAPSHVHILAGVLEDGAADLKMDHEAALGTDLIDAMGSFILKTPTTHDTDDDDAQGIWFLQITQEGPAPALELPELPTGWVYEGWVVGEDGPISTGRFSAGNEADDDGAGETAGPDGFPGFAGQDFIAPPVSLIGHTAVITVEPEPDNSPGPFTLKPLIAPSIADAGGGVLQTMENRAADTNVTGSAYFEDME